MIETRHPISPTHLPWFITQPGQIDTLMVFTAAFLLLFTVTMGVLMLRLLYLPEKMVPQEQKAKYEVVATLCLLAAISFDCRSIGGDDRHTRLHAAPPPDS